MQRGTENMKWEIFKYNVATVALMVLHFFWRLLKAILLLPVRIFLVLLSNPDGRLILAVIIGFVSVLVFGVRW